MNADNPAHQKEIEHLDLIQHTEDLCVYLCYYVVAMTALSEYTEVRKVHSVGLSDFFFLCQQFR